MRSELSLSPAPLCAGKGNFRARVVPGNCPTDQLTDPRPFCRRRRPILFESRKNRGKEVLRMGRMDRRTRHGQEDC